MIQKSRSFQDLIVWQKAHALVLAIYKKSEAFPQDELYGLTSQLRRSAISVPANIAEGFRRRGRLDKIRFLNIAQSSLEETRYYLILVRDLNLSDTHELLQLTEEVSKLLESYAGKILSSDS